MIAEQLELIEMTETDRLNEKIQACTDAANNLRRGMFSRHDALFKMYSEIKDEIEESRLENKQLRQELEQIKFELAQIAATINLYSKKNFLPQEDIGKELGKFIPFRF